VRTHTAADGSLVVTYESTGLPKLLFGVGALFAAQAIYDVTIGTRGTDRMIGLLGAIAVCVGSGLVLWERSHFIFDPRTRTVRWRRRWAWSEKSGTLEFSQLRNVIAQTMGESREYPDRRISLQTVEGSLVPLTQGYAPDAKGELVQLAGRIRDLLGAATPASDEGTLRALVGSGQTMEAIRLLREQGMSLTEAKQRLDRLK
jgi:hypothetical protein